MVDTVGEKGDLPLGRTGVLRFSAILFKDVGLYFLG
jgi:hypothetical protein